MATKIITIIGLTLFLNACALSPGLYLDIKPSGFFAENPEEAPNYKLVPLDAEVLVEQYKEDIMDAVAEEEMAESEEKSDDSPLTSEDEHVYKYYIQPQDVLFIIVWEHPELTIPAGEFRSADATGRTVAPDGTIFFPYVGRLKVVGKTAEEVGIELSRKLARFIENPQLDVRVADFRSQKVYVTGDIGANVLPITDEPLYMLDAINRSGGISENKDLKEVRLIRGDKIYLTNLLDFYDNADLSKNYLLQDGDVIHVLSGRDKRVFVMGETGQSVQFFERGELTLLSALQNAGGIRQNSGEDERVYVIRAAQEKPIVYHFKANTPEALVIATQFQLKPLDVVYVSTADVVRLNRTLSNIIPLIRAPLSIEDVVDQLAN